MVKDGRERRRAGFRHRPSWFDVAFKYSGPPATTGRDQRAHHYPPARTPRGDAEEVHDNGRGTDAARAERAQQYSEQSEGLSGPARRLEREHADGAQAGR